MKIKSLVDKLEIENEKEQLIELIKYKKSPWYEIIDWTKDGDFIRETKIKDNNFKFELIYRYFKSLKLNDKYVRYFIIL